MTRPGTFAFRGITVTPWNPLPAAVLEQPTDPQQPATGSPGLPTGPRQSAAGPVSQATHAHHAASASRQDPIRELLQSLRGREVLLQVGDRLVAGKLVTYDPVLLVDQEGRSTLVRFEAIQAVTF